MIGSRSLGLLCALLDLMRSFKRKKVTRRRSCHNGDAEWKARDERTNESAVVRLLLDVCFPASRVLLEPCDVKQLSTWLQEGAAPADLTHLYPLPFYSCSIRVTQEKRSNDPVAHNLIAPIHHFIFLFSPQVPRWGEYSSQ